MFDEVLADLLRDGYSARFAAAGDSMYPTIRSGEHLHVTRAAPESLRRGDVVLTRAARGLTAHRIVTIADGQVITRGDAMLRRDAPVALHAVVARVTAVERDGIARPIAPAPLFLRRVVRALRITLSPR